MRVASQEVSWPMVRRSAAITILSFISIVFGLGVAIANPLILTYIVYHGTGPVLFGIEFLDGKSLIGAALGHDGVVVLGTVFTGTAVLGVVSGFWLRRSLKKGGKLAAALLMPYLSFGIGFEVPALYVLVPLMLILLSIGWRTLR